MSRDELVEGYLAGQLSRRVFVRGLVATGVAAATAVSYASVLDAMPAGAVVDNFYLIVRDFAIAPSPVPLAYGQGVTVSNQSRTGHQHSVADASGMGLFTTGPIPVQSVRTIKLPSAGTYSVRCSETTNASHPFISGQLRVPLVIAPSSGTPTTKFTIRWSPRTALPTGTVVDVQRKAPGSTTWTTWKTGHPGVATTVQGLTRGTWSFRARLRRASDGKVTGWSPSKNLVIS